MMKQSQRFWLFGWIFCTVLLACTLSDAPPATLIPRMTPTVTPPPTIGYSTRAPTTQSQVPQSNAPVEATPDPGLLSLMNQIQTDRLMAHVRTLQDLGTRHVNSSQSNPNHGVGAAANYITGELEKIRDESNGNLYVFPHEFPVTWAGVNSVQRNIAAIISGTDVGAGTLIIGAHYDSRGDDIEDGVGYAPGANDNGSGVGGLIEIARVLSKKPHRATIMIVFFAAEEIGRKGSIAFVNDYVKAQNIDLRLYINVDAIGSQSYANGAVNDYQMRVFSAGPNATSPSRVYARYLNLVAFNFVPWMDIAVIDARDRDGRYGDHFSFYEAGYTAVRVMEMAENSANLDTEDTIDGVSPGYLQRSTQTLLALLTVLADGPPPPINVTLRDNGDGTQTLVWASSADATSYIVALRSPNSLIYNQFETNETSIRWDGFQQYASLIVCAKDQSGLIGPPSTEIIIQPGV